MGSKIEEPPWHRFRLALPSLPESALVGLPGAADLPTPERRRRYGVMVAWALLGEASYEVEVYNGAECPALVQLRALEEGWPLIGTPTRVSLMPRHAPTPGGGHVVMGTAPGALCPRTDCHCHPTHRPHACASRPGLCSPPGGSRSTQRAQPRVEVRSPFKKTDSTRFGGSAIVA